MESGEEVVVGVNRWQRAEEAPPVVRPTAAEAVATRQVERLTEWRSRRDAARCEAELERLADVARGEGNLVPVIRAACAAGATVGEIADTLRAEFGSYRDPAGFDG